MSNSPLVVFTKISPNRTSPRNHEIDTISIHCVVGQVTAESLGDIFAPTSKEASSNYGVDKNGRIGMYVEEKDCSWCTSSSSNDHRAITIEVASDSTHPYKVNYKAYNALIDLLVDICKRNPKIGYLKWKADKSLIGQVDKQNMTVHRWFANKSCPGDYLYNLHYDIVEKVNARLSVQKPVEDVTPVKPTTPAVTIKKGDLVKLSSNATYYNGKSIPDWVKKQNWFVREDPVGDRVVIDKNESGSNAINSPVNIKYVNLVKSVFKPYLVQVSIEDLNMRTGPSTSYPSIGFIPKGVYTIVEEKDKWGRLKAKQSYKGKSVDTWIHLDYVKKV